jgi:hypothetical protein
MSIDKQRIAAVRTLEALGYTWQITHSEGLRWAPPPAPPRQSQLTVERDLDLLRATICRFFHTSYEQTIPLVEEIKGWGWFR